MITKKEFVDIINRLKETDDFVNMVNNKARELKAELAKEGIIAEIPVGDGYQHFDANAADHIHFHCTNCGKIYDCPTPDNSLKDYIEKTLDCSVTAEKRMFVGQCSACRGLNKN